MNKNKENLISLRKLLHQKPELSGQEADTARTILQAIKQYQPDEIIENLAGQSFAVIYHFSENGRTIVFRAELDALPIEETNNFRHRSTVSNQSHACGHDGHLMILLGLAELLQSHRHDLQGKVILLFQSAEETAAGAVQIMQEKRFGALQPDYVFALHNLPGFPLPKIILKKGLFTATSIGLKVNLLGETSHAGHPENGRNPVLAMTSIINDLLALPQLITPYQSAALITIIHARLGKEAFGTSPAEAQIMSTFRAESDHILQKMKEQAVLLIHSLAKAHQLEHKIEWVEYFPAIINDDKCVELLESAAQNLNLPYQYQEKPFSWTEDFSFFTQKIKGAFFGMGAGINHPQLHNSHYDFPDELIETGAAMFFQIIREIQEKTE